MNQCAFIAKLKRIIVLVTICDYKTISFRQYNLSTCIIQGHWRYYLNKSNFWDLLSIAPKKNNLRSSEMNIP
jgi:hypothetical protein